MNKIIYPKPEVKMRHSDVKEMPTAKQIMEWIVRLYTIDIMKSDGVNVSVANNKGFLWKNFMFALKEEEDKDDFYSTMMGLSMTHWIAAVSDGLNLYIYLKESSDGQTNITPSVIDALYRRMVDKEFRDACMLYRFEYNGIHLSA